MEWVRPKLYDLQHRAIFTPARFSVIEACTKSGKTVGSMAWLTEKWMLAESDSANYWWVAPTRAQAKIAFRRTKRGLPANVYHHNLSDLTLTNKLTGATMWYMTAEKPDNLYGEDVHGAVVDEASRCREDSWHAVRSTLTSTKGPCRIIGNVRGKKNWAYRLGRQAAAGELPGFEFYRITSGDAVAAGVLDAEEVAAARRELPGAVFDELYEAIASEEGANPFGIENIRACVTEAGGGPPVVWGWDLGRKQDWTVGVGLDENGVVSSMFRFRESWRVTVNRIIKATAGVPALVDATGVGDAVVERLQEKGGENFQGFVFTSASKQRLMEGLALALQDHELRYPDGVMVTELEDFTYEHTRNGVRYTAPEGYHDDCVCALALARMATGMEFATALEAW